MKDLSIAISAVFYLSRSLLTSSPQTICCAMRLELPILSFVVLPLLLLPLPSHLKAGNIALIALGTTLFLVNFIRGINSVRSSPSLRAIKTNTRSRLSGQIQSW